MIKNTDIKQNEKMFYFEEYLKFKGRTILFDIYKSDRNVKGILTEIH